MKKNISFFLVLTLSVGMWADTQNVSYLYPEYNGGDVTKGVKEWKTTTVDAEVVENFYNVVTWGTTGETTWYVVTGADVQLTEGAVCQGDVRLILADNAKLTAKGINNTDRQMYTPGIQVSGDGNSLTIYGQTNNKGELYVSGGKGTAGIGGEYLHSGSNITIHGGNVTAQGGTSSMDVSGGGAGIGGGQQAAGSNIIINGGKVVARGGTESAGIGGGYRAEGSNIIINGGHVVASGKNHSAGIGGGTSASASDIIINAGTVIATGEEWAAGIGGGYCGSGSNIAIHGGNVTAHGGSLSSGIGSGRGGTAFSNITIATHLLVKGYDDLSPQKTIIAPLRTATTDIANDLADKQHVDIEIDPLLNDRDAAIAEINAAFEGIDNDNIKAIATLAYSDIKKAITTDEIDFFKTRTIANINFAKAAYNDAYIAGDASGYQRAKGELPTDPEGTVGHTVTVTKGDKTLVLVNPDLVKYGKQ